MSGTDVDPLAVELVRHEIESFDEQEFVVLQIGCLSSFSSESAIYSKCLARSGRLSTISTFMKSPVPTVGSAAPYTKTSSSPGALRRAVRLLGTRR